MINAIFANDLSGGFGYKGRLPWPTIPEDMYHFRKVTNNNFVVMGRKTAETIPTLPNRISVILTTNKEYPTPPNSLVTESIDNVVAFQEAYPDLDIFLIGGLGLLTVDNLKLCTNIYHTTINGSYPADTFVSEEVKQYLDSLKEELILGTTRCRIRKLYAEL